MLIVTLSVTHFFDPIFGIKSAYVLLGLGLAMGIHQVSGSSQDLDFTKRRSELSLILGKLVVLIVLLSFTAVAASKLYSGTFASMVRAGVLIVGVPAGSGLLILQLRSGASNGWLFPQILALFALDPVTKLLTNGFYFGRGDLPKHVHSVDTIVQAGTYQAIDTASFAHYFPGLQSLGAAVSVMFWGSSYEALLIAGIVVYGFVIAVTYLLAKFVLVSNRLPLFVAFGVSLLAPIHRHSIYFYPQALAVALVLLLLLLGIAYRERRLPGNLSYVLFIAPVIVTLWVTHHLTVILFLPILIGLLVFPTILEKQFRLDDVRRPHALPLLVWILGSVAYWELRGVFTGPFLNSMQAVMSRSSVVTESDTGSAITALGRQIPEPSIWDAIQSLFSVSGLYNELLICVAALGAIAIFELPNEYRRAAGFVTVGIIGMAMMVKTPILAPGIKRFQLPLSLFVAFVLGAGLARLVAMSDRSMGSVVLGTSVVLALTFAGPAVVADDLYGLHSGPNLWEKRTLPGIQKEFNPAEMHGFRRASSFIDRESVRVQTDWQSTLGLARYGTDSESFDVEDGRIIMDGELLLYRERWPEHSLRLIPERFDLKRLLVSDSWQRSMIRTENKVYTTGEISMLADRSAEPRFIRRPA